MAEKEGHLKVGYSCFSRTTGDEFFGFVSLCLVSQFVMSLTCFSINRPTLEID